MTQLETLASIQGRALIRDIYRELRYERRVSALQALSTCWRVCTKEQELIRLTKRDVVVLHPLGTIEGGTLWMQEIVNRFFYPQINAFVYAGAALLLVAVGLNRTEVIDAPSIVVLGIVIEALLLLLLFAVMFFSPPDDPTTDDGSANQQSSTDEILREMGEIGRDYAAMAVQLETISATLTDLVERQDATVNAMRQSVDAAVSAVAPNPQMMSSLTKTTEALDAFAQSVSQLNHRLQAVERQEVEHLVRSELEKILSQQILKK